MDMMMMREKKHMLMYFFTSLLMGWEKGKSLRMTEFMSDSENCGIIVLI
jgi:hypothetical protein